MSDAKPNWKHNDRALARRAKQIHAPKGFKVPGDRLQFSDRRYVVGPHGNYIRVETAKPVPKP